MNTHGWKKIVYVYVYVYYWLSMMLSILYIDVMERQYMSARVAFSLHDVLSFSYRGSIIFKLIYSENM